MLKYVVFLRVWCFVAVVMTVWLVPAAGQKVNQPQKADDPTPVAKPVMPAAPKVVPKLGVIVRVPPGKQAPERLKKYALPDGGFTAPRLRIGVNDQESIAIALEDPDLHVEFDRPKRFVPVLEIHPENLDARISHRVPEFEADFPGIRGKTVKVAVFDEGRIRDTHQEFQDSGVSRVTVKTSKVLSRHSTHCAGTVGAKGVEIQAIGMATQVRLFSYDWDNDITNLNTDSPNFQVSTHSYGPISGWMPNYPMTGKWNWWGGLNDDEDARYGKYTDECSQLDEVLAARRHLVTLFAAGNDRGRGPTTQPTAHYVVATGTYSSRVRPRTGGTTGTDSVTGCGLAKNAICIGAINDIPQGGGPNTIQITSFSGVGPADDGRVKPDLVANGFQLFSTSESADDAFVDLSGTSMATPTAAGIAGLLWELYRATYQRDPTSAEIKATLVHTARDGGVPGPDPQYGWGAINAQLAGRLVKGARGQFVGDPSQNTVAEGATKTFAFTAAASGEPVRVTLVWTDPAASPNAGGVDDATAVLQNDLDLKVTAPNGTVYRPYSLDLANLWNPATNQPRPARTDRANRVDNVEVVDAPSAQGQWKIEVTGFKLKSGPTQSFALTVTGLKPVP